jgi:hypothetical protein
VTQCQEMFLEPKVRSSDGEVDKQNEHDVISVRTSPVVVTGR